jgi:hypothetical protein
LCCMHQLAQIRGLVVVVEVRYRQTHADFRQFADFAYIGFRSDFGWAFGSCF